MARIPSKRPWIGKPPTLAGPSDLARKIGLTNLISAVSTSGTIADSVTGQLHSLGGAASWQARAFGSGVDFATDGDEITFASDIPFVRGVGARWGVFIHLDTREWRGSQSGFLREGVDSNGFSYFVRNANGYPEVKLDGTIILAPSSGQTVDTGDHTLLLEIENGASVRLYIDGVLAHQAAHTVEPWIGRVWRRYGWQWNTSETFRGDTFTLAFFSEGVSAEIAQRLHDTRGGALFQPRTVLVPVGGTGIAVSASRSVTTESRSGVDLFIGSSMEHLSAARQSRGGSTETLRRSNQVASRALETLTLGKRQKSSFIENIVSLSRAELSAIETRLGVTAQQLAVVEQLAGISASAVVQIEAGQGLIAVSNAITSAVESMRGVAMQRTVRLESTTSLLAVSNAILSSIESLQGVSRAEAAPVAVLAGLVRTAAGDLECISQVVVTGPAALEAMRQTSKGLVASAEALALVSAAAGVRIEALGAGILPTYEDLEMVLRGELDLEMILTDIVDVH